MSVKNWKQNGRSIFERALPVLKLFEMSVVSALGQNMFGFTLSSI